MSLRSVGDQLIQTAPGRVLDGATVASASFWIQINPANNVAATAGVEVFGDSGGVFSATVLGTNLLRLQWTAVSGGNSVASSCTVGLEVGTSYHVASTWQSGTQAYYLNGIAIAADSQVGALGLVVATKGRSFQLGSNQPGTDVTLAQPALWVGYALEPSDVIALRNGTSAPGLIAPGSIALIWTLDGTAGAQAAVGDPGLKDGSPHALALSTIVGSAPTYQAGDLAYTPAPAFGQVAASPSAESIILTVCDPQGNPLNVAGVQPTQAVQQIGLFGRPAGDAITLKFNGVATSPLATTTGPPIAYFLWTPPTIAGHSYSLAVYWWTNFATATGLDYYFETLDGGATLATRLITQTPTPDQFEDPAVGPVDTYTTYWNPITPGGGVVASDSSLSVRITAGNSEYYAIGALRVQDLTAGTVAYYTLGDTLANTSTYTSAPLDYWTQDSNGVYYGGSRYRGYGSTSYGPVTVIAPSGSTTGASLLQAALAAIPAIGEGNVSVVDQSGGGTGSYQVTFTGTLGDSAVPALACADPAFSVEVVSPGGQGFVLDRADGSSLLLLDVLWSEAGDCPFIQLPLPQSKPQVQTWPVRNLPCVLAGGYWDGPDYSLSSSVSKDPLYGWSAGLTASFTAQRLPVGTYQWAITWPNRPFSYTSNSTAHACLPSTATQFLIQDSGGNTLATHSVDQTKAPSDYVDAGGTAWHILGTSAVTARDTTLTLVMTTVGQSAAASGQTQSVAILDAVQFTRTSADTSIILGPGDSLAVPAGFITTASGPASGMASMPIAPASPSAILAAFEPTPKTMKLGWGIGLHGYPADFPLFSNLAYLMNTMGIATDADGYPTKISCPNGTNYELVVSGSAYGTTTGLPFQGATFTPAGNYLLTWDGDPIFSLSPSDGTTISPVAVPRPANAPANWQVYEVSYDTNITNRPQFTFKTDCTRSTPDPTDPSGTIFDVNLTNLGIYPPDPSDPTGRTVWGLSADGTTWTKPPKYWPHALAKVAGANCLRFMNGLNINGQPGSTFDFFKPDTHANRSAPTYNPKTKAGIPGVAVSVVSIRPAAASECPLLPNVGPVLVIETTGNSNFYDGATFNFLGCGTADFSGSATPVALDSNTSGVSGIVIGLIDATHILAMIVYSPFGVMTNTTTGGTLLGQNFGTISSLQDIIDLVEAVGESCTRVHLNVPMSIDVSAGGALAQYAQFMAANLPSWVTELAIEPGNEVWNFTFPVNPWATVRSILDEGSPPTTLCSSVGPAPFYARRSKQFHDAFLAAFASAGRPGLVRRLFGSQAGNPQVTSALLAQLQAIGAGADLDEVCVAFYVNPWAASGFGTDQSPISNRMTTGQLLDYGELIAEYGGYPALYVTNQLAVLRQANLPDASLVAYEGSMSGLLPVDPTWALGFPPGNTPDYAIRSHAAIRHPRMYGIMLRHSQKFQDAGAAAWCYFYLGGDTSDNPWACFASDTQPFGTGNPATDSIGIANPMDCNNAPNQVAGALRTWANLVPGGSTPPPPPPPPTTTPVYPLHRNGSKRAIGTPLHGQKSTRGK